MNETNLKSRITGLISQMRYHVVALMLAGILAVAGTGLAGRYGMAWDEYDMRELGYKDYNYVTKGGEHKPNGFYGSIIELPLVLIELKLGITDYQAIFTMRHLVCHFLFILGGLAVYMTLSGLFGKRRYGLLGMLFYFTFPTIYGHSFFNSKDIPFLSILAITLYTYWRLIAQRNWLWFVAAGAMTGLLVNSRIIGVIAFPSLGLALLAGVLMMPERFRWKALLPRYIVLCVTAALSLYITWPMLWEHPIASFTEILTKSSNYSLVGSENLLQGSWYNANKLPASYLPLWMLVTVPVVVQLFFVAGLVAAIRNRMKRTESAQQADEGVFFVLALLLFVFPMTMEIVLRSPIFDGWRHMSFMYLPVMLIAVFGVRVLLLQNSRMISIALVALLAYHSFSTFAFMLKHPVLQHLYFNEYVSRKPEHIRKNYDFDYWGSSYRGCLEFILNDSKADTVRILAANSPGRFNQFMLTRPQRDRIKFVDSLGDAEYFMSNYRWNPQDYPLKQQVFRQEVLNSTVSAVWKVQPAEKGLKIRVDK